MNPQNTSSAIINQLMDVTMQMQNEEFAKPLAILSGNTIGKHIRHIIEFYDCLLRGYESRIVDYDKRAHNSLIEIDKRVAIDEMEKINSAISCLPDVAMRLSVTYGDEIIVSQTSFNREIVYNIEHAIHHMAIIKIALQNNFQNIKVHQHFGLAYSTVKFQEEQCVQ